MSSRRHAGGGWVKGRIQSAAPADKMKEHRMKGDVIGRQAEAQKKKKEAEEEGG